MARTVIDVDGALLADAARALGAATKTETVRSAPREALDTRRRALALHRLRTTAADGAFDLELLENKGNYRG